MQVKQIRKYDDQSEVDILEIKYSTQGSLIRLLPHYHPDQSTIVLSQLWCHQAKS
jgi:hypothetical protein